MNRAERERHIMGLNGTDTRRHMEREHGYKFATYSRGGERRWSVDGLRVLHLGRHELQGVIGGHRHAGETQPTVERRSRFYCCFCGSEILT